MGGAIALDSAGNLYIADAGSGRIRKVNTSGIINTIAGGGSGSLGDGGNPLLAILNSPEGVAVSNSGDIYIGDVVHNRIRLVTTHPVGISNLYNKGGNITMYPNPANEEVNIETNPKGNSTVIITDILERLIYKNSFTNKIQISTANCQPGVYYVQVISENGYKEVQKLIVQ